MICEMSKSRNDKGESSILLPRPGFLETSFKILVAKSTFLLLARNFSKSELMIVTTGVSLEDALLCQ